MSSKKETTSGSKSFSATEIHKMISKIDSLEDEVLLLLALNTGLRRYDISHLLVANINVRECAVTFSEKKKGGMVRTIHISEDVMRKVSQFINTFQRGRRYLFTWGSKKYGDKTAYNRLQKMCDKAGVRKRPFHALRSTCIKFCIDGGWRMEQVCDLTGDTQEVIQWHYMTPGLSEMKEVAQKKPIFIPKG